MNDTDIAQLKDLIALEATGAFTASNLPSAFSLREAVDTLFDFLRHKSDSSPLQAVGDDVIAGLQTYIRAQDLTKLCVRMEPFAMAVLHLVDQSKHDALWTTSAARTPPGKPGFAAVLKKDGLDVATKSTFESAPDALRGEPRFAEHVSRVYTYRNPEAHEAHRWAPRLKAEIFESICIFLIFVVAEYRDRIESALLVRKYKSYLATLTTRYSEWKDRFIEIRCDQFRSGELLNRDPLIQESGAQPSEAWVAAIKTAPLPHPPTLLELVTSHHRFVLVGDPGAGKTTALRSLARHLADQLLTQPAKALPLPVYLELKNCGSPPRRTLVQQVALEPHPQLTLESAAFRRQAILLLDGLNEVASADQKSIRDQIEEVLMRYPRLHVIVTTRRDTYLGELDIPSFLLASLTDEQIVAFVGKHIRDEAKCKEIIPRLKRDPKIWGLCRNPWWLAALMQLALSADSALPRNRGTLLQKLTRGVLNRESLQLANQTSTVKKETLISYLAYETRTEGEVGFTTRRAIDLLNKARRKHAIESPFAHEFMNELLHNNLLVNTGPGEVAFAHEIYQEFFAALEVKWRFEDEDASSTGPVTVDHEVMRFYADLVNDHSGVAQGIASRNAFTAAKIYLDSGYADNLLRELICEQAYLQATAKSGDNRWFDGVFALAILNDLQRLENVITKFPDFSEDYLTVLVVIADAKDDSEPPLLPDSQAAVVSPVIIRALKQKSAGDPMLLLASVTWDRARPQISESYLKAAIETGFKEGVFNLGYRLTLDSKGDPERTALGDKCIQMAAEAGFESAYVYHGMILKAKDLPQEAAVWFRKSAEAEVTRHPGAMLQLAALLLEDLTGHGIDAGRIAQDPGEPELRLKQARHCGIPKAEAEAETVLKKWEAAVIQHRESAEAGHTKDMVWLGEVLIGLPAFSREAGEAEKWLRMAASMGDVDANLRLAERLLDGNALNQDIVEGEKIFREIAALNAKAKQRFARRLLDGVGIARNQTEGERMLRELAEAGEWEAIIELSSRLKEGRSLVRNKEDAKHWIKQLELVFRKDLE